MTANNSQVTARKAPKRGAKAKPSAKPRGRGKGKPFQKGKGKAGDPRINRKGAPPKGSSMKEVLAYFDELTNEEILELLPAGKLRRRYARQPKELLVKHVRAMAALIELQERPTAQLAAYIDDRIDGKVPDEMNVNGSLEVENLSKFIKDVYGKKKADE